VGTYDLLNVVRACAIGSLVLGAASFLEPLSIHVPRSVLVIDFALTLLGIGGVRAWPAAFRALRQGRDAASRSVLVVGGGEAGASLVRSLKGSAVGRVHVVGFIDDDPKKRGTYIHGVKVLGSRSELPGILQSGAIEEVLIAMPSASGKVIQETVAMVRRSRVQSMKIVPDLDAVLSGKVAPSSARDVRVEDLLERPIPALDLEGVHGLLSASTVLVTGAAGSIGSELCRHLARVPVGRLVLLDQNETGIFDLERELRRLPDAPPVEAVVGNVRDGGRIGPLMERYRPGAVFHAAAYKHVPLMELHPREAVRTNVLGTLTMAQEAVAVDAKTFVLISTDKAVHPASVMGATKRLAEMMVGNLFLHTQTTFVTLRFGNVLGTRGSLVPVLEEQIRSGGPITVTHPDMERFFMTSTEAVFLILNALLEGKNGDILVLEMGEPIRLMELVQAVARLAGVEPDVDMPITFVGARPGEKRTEQLTAADERAEPTGRDRIRRIRQQVPVDVDGLLEGLALLTDAVANGAEEDVRRILREVVPAYAEASALRLPEEMLIDTEVRP
jgi:FlaA1/EpsC-like NDP-sugar epimerase